MVATRQSLEKQIEKLETALEKARSDLAKKQLLDKISSLRQRLTGLDQVDKVQGSLF